MFTIIIIALIIMFISLIVVVVGIYNSLYGVKQTVNPSDNGCVTIVTQVIYDGNVVDTVTDTVLTYDADDFIIIRKKEAKDKLKLYKKFKTI